MWHLVRTEVKIILPWLMKIQVLQSLILVGLRFLVLLTFYWMIFLTVVLIERLSYVGLVLF